MKWDNLRFAEAAERLAAEWMESIDRSEGVGSRHHTVPQFYLRRFSNSSKQLLVRDRETGKHSLRHCKDLAIRDFYTFIAKDGESDGSLEQIFRTVEGMTATVLRKILNPFTPPSKMELVHSAALAQFLSLQIVRGPRRRREIELEIDYFAKVQTGHLLTDKDLQELVVVPHPNEHLSIIGPTAFAIFEYLLNRPVCLIVIDKPLFITCDEPVLVNVGKDHVVHNADCFITARDLEKRKRKAFKRGRDYRQVIHMYPTRPSGVAEAAEIAITVSPRSLVVLGPIGASSTPRCQLSGAEAEELAQRVNGDLVNQAFDWVAAHPENSSFRDMEFPPVGPIMRVCDGGSIMSENLKNPPLPRKAQRFKKDW